MNSYKEKTACMFLPILLWIIYVSSNLWLIGWCSSPVTGLRILTLIVHITCAKTTCYQFSSHLVLRIGWLGGQRLCSPNSSMTFLVTYLSAPLVLCRVCAPSTVSLCILHDSLLHCIGTPSTQVCVFCTLACLVVPFSVVSPPVS